MMENFARRLTLKELLGLSDPAQRLAGLADLSQRPSRGGDRPWKQGRRLLSAACIDAVLDQWARLRPVAFEEVQHAGGEVGPTDRVGMPGRLGKLERLRLVLGR